MCGSMAYIQSAAAEIRRGKKEEGRKKKNKLQYENIMVCPIPYDDHNRVAKNRHLGMHHRTNLSGYIFATKARIDNRKNLFKHQYLLHSPRYMANFRPLTAEIG